MAGALPGATCPTCGTEIAGAAKFCSECGTRLAQIGEARRRLVTAVFCDLVGSTELAERLDPETLRRLLDGYFGAMRAVIESHGGTVEKFAGDAVIAAFGIPTAHEDDALRAVRAGLDLAAAAERLDRDAGASVRLAVRVTISTGETFVDDAAAAEGRIGGDVFNTASRLQGAAGLGEVVVAAATERLVRGRVDMVSIGDVEVRGKIEPITAYRVEGLRSAQSRAETPFLGRERMLRSLAAALADAVDAQACVLATILAPPGVGKSRLAEAFVEDVRDQATVLVGQTPAYGDGVTFAPLVEILAQVADRPVGDASTVATALRLRLEAQPDGAAVADRLAQMLGVREASASDAAWAIRRTLEVLAAERPLVVVLEDLHAAEAPMLDLVDAVVDRFHGPCLVVCLARPELLELRPTWAAAKPRSVSSILSPLEAGPARVLADHLLGGTAPAAIVERLCEVAEGNPLYLEQLTAMLDDEGLISDGRWVGPPDVTLDIPPSLHALLAARVDRLEPTLRSLLERAAIEGRRFRREALGILAPAIDTTAVDEALAALDRRGLVSPEDEATGRWRFSHPLIQETAYRGVSKSLRAELHERLADWMARADADRPDVDESVARQLERAVHLREELGGRDGHAEELAVRAGELYADAGSRAFAAVDLVTTRDLLGRAAELLPAGSPRRLDILPNLGVALSETGQPGGDRGAAWRCDRAGARPGIGARRVARAGPASVDLVYRSPGDAEVEVAVEEATLAMSAFAAMQDPVGLAEAGVTLEYLEWIRGRVGTAHRWAIGALEHALAAGSPREAMQAAAEIAGYAVAGPKPFPDLPALAADLDARRDDPITSSTGHTLRAIASLAAGDREEFRAQDARRRDVVDRHGLGWLSAAQALHIGCVMLSTGDAVEAEQLLVEARDVLSAAGDIWWIVQIDSFVASALAAQDRRREFLQRADAVSEHPRSGPSVAAPAGPHPCPRRPRPWRRGRRRAIGAPGRRAGDDDGPAAGPSGVLARPRGGARSARPPSRRAGGAGPGRGGLSGEGRCGGRRSSW